MRTTSVLRKVFVFDASILCGSNRAIAVVRKANRWSIPAKSLKPFLGSEQLHLVCGLSADTAFQQEVVVCVLKGGLRDVWFRDDRQFSLHIVCSFLEWHITAFTAVMTVVDPRIILASNDHLF